MFKYIIYNNELQDKISNFLTLPSTTLAVAIQNTFYIISCLIYKIKQPIYKAITYR